MKKTFLIIKLLLVSFLFMSLIVRHDVPDKRCVELGKKYPQICHLEDGEATLIKENWLLTAAHAAVILSEELEKGSSPKVIIGNHKYDVEKVVLHPEFTMTATSIKNDIALLKIKGGVTNIPYAKLYGKENEKGSIITLVGRGDYGTGITGPKKADKVTRAVTNKIDGVSKEWLYFSFDSPESNNTTELEGVSGPGDSGGPAFVDVNGVRYIIGVSSHQLDDGKQGVYGVVEYYSRVSYFKNWIEKSIK